MPRQRPAKKEFVPGQRVEVQREVGKPWEPAAYERADDDMRGWHGVRLDQPWFIDPRSGMETTRELGMCTTFKLVPTQRIRAITAPAPTITDHAYLSAGDTHAASGGRAYSGCFVCGGSRKEHAT